MKQKKINSKIKGIIGDKITSLDSIIYNVFKIHQNLKKNKIHYCLIYIGEKEGNNYEENKPKYINFDIKNKKGNSNYVKKKESNIDDIAINIIISEYINTLSRIEYEFWKFLKKLASELIFYSKTKEGRNN